MKRLTNKVLVALSLLSVAGSVFGNSKLEFWGKIFNNIQDVTVDDMLNVYPGVGKARAAVQLDFLKSSIAVKRYVSSGAVPQEFPRSVVRELGAEMTAKAVFGFLKPLAEQGAKIQADGINAGLSGLSHLAVELDFSTLSQRVAMKNGMVNKISEVARTAANTTVGKFVRSHPVVLGALAVTGVGAGLFGVANYWTQGYLVRVLDEKIRKLLSIKPAEKK